MFKINCNVDNCAHNNTGTCFANIVNVGGPNANTSCNTCCTSFLDKKNYGNLTNNTNSEGCCDALTCKVDNCVHNENKLCTLSSITVTGDNVNLYSETACKSFE